MIEKPSKTIASIRGMGIFVLWKDFLDASGLFRWIRYTHRRDCSNPVWLRWHPRKLGKVQAALEGILNRYSTPYFHFREFRWEVAQYPKSVYFGWDSEMRRAFLHELALAISMSALPIGGSHLADTISKNERSVSFRGVIKKFYTDFAIPWTPFCQVSMKGRSSFLTNVNTTRNGFTP